MYIQFHERLLSYYILRRRIQKRINQENFDLYTKCEELLISAARMRERRKLGSSEKAFW